MVQEQQKASPVENTQEEQKKKIFIALIVRLNRRGSHRQIGAEELYETKEVSCLHQEGDRKQLYSGKLSLPLTYIFWSELLTIRE